jgi:uncharacterized damage-inducible protein DinB
MDSNLCRLYEHLGWADNEIFAALELVRNDSETPRKLTAHIVRTEQIWLSRIQSIDIGQLTPWTSLSISECRELSARVLSAYQAVIESSPDDQLDKLIIYRNMKGIEYQTPLRDILLHVALHGAYHRGQIAALLRASGLEPPSTDFILFSWQAQTNPQAT